MENQLKNARFTTSDRFKPRVCIAYTKTFKSTFQFKVRKETNS